MECSPPGSSVHGISQVWILEWVAISFSRVGIFPNPGIKPVSLVLAGGFFTTEPPGKPIHTDSFYLICTDSNEGWPTTGKGPEQLMVPSKTLHTASPCQKCHSWNFAKERRMLDCYCFDPYHTPLPEYIISPILTVWSQQTGKFLKQ